VEALRLEAAGTRRDRLRVLVPLFGGDGATMPLAAPGYGAIELDQDACVACGACAVACPTDALRLDPTVAELSVTDIDCVGCGACVSACPDDALTLHPAIPAGAAALEPRVLLEDRAVACRRCGRLYAAERLLAHARSVLEAADVDPDDPRFQLGVCPSCRAVDARDRPLDQLPAHGQGCACGGDCGCGGDLAPAGVGSDRRTFLKGTLATIAAGAALPLFGRSRPAFGVEEAPVIRPGRLGMVIDLERCIGCHACTNVCKAENDVPLGGFRDWVEEHELASGTDDVRPYFLPKLCNHCDEPGCLKACPTGAIYRRPDGIIDLDPNICIACQACMHGCPYGMTFYNASRRTADKCNYCAHRIDEGLRPACVDICPSQCRIFGDLEDPDSPPSRYLATHETSVIREELGLGPNTYYVGLPGELNR
jgi:tetrathionate reductase subunit B